MVAGCWRAGATEASKVQGKPEGIPTMAAGVYTAPADVARCQALLKAVQDRQSVRVLPPRKRVELRSKPANFRNWHDHKDTDSQGFAAEEEKASACVVPFLVSEPFERAPVIDRLTGLMWLGKPPRGEVGVEGATTSVRKVRTDKAAGFSDWRLPTMPELASVLLIKPGAFVEGAHWSVNRGPDCTWTLDTKAGFAFCASAAHKDTAHVLPVRAGALSTEAPPRAKAGFVGSAAELADCMRGEWLKLVEGRDVPVIPGPGPATLRAAPATIPATDLVARLRALYLHGNGQRCFVNDFRPNADGTVLDAATGLLWEVASSREQMSWNAARAYVSRLNGARYLGQQDWRLPTAEEAATLIESARFLFPWTQLDPAVFATSETIWTADLEPGGKRAFTLDTRTGKLGTLTDTPESVSDEMNFVKVVRSSRKK